MHPVQCLQDQAGANGFVVAWDAKTGREKWRFNTAPIESSPLLVGHTLYYGAWDRKVHAVDARTGRTVWSFPSGKYANPVVADKKRIYLTGRSAVFGLKPRR
jgi:outer membrane protein assembly factor BamB